MEPLIYIVSDDIIDVLECGNFFHCAWFAWFHCEIDTKHETIKAAAVLQSVSMLYNFHSMFLGFPICVVATAYL